MTDPNELLKLQEAIGSSYAILPTEQFYAMANKIKELKLEIKELKMEEADKHRVMVIGDGMHDSVSVTARTVKYLESSGFEVVHHTTPIDIPVGITDRKGFHGINHIASMSMFNVEDLEPIQLDVGHYSWKDTMWPDHDFWGDNCIREPYELDEKGIHRFNKSDTTAPYKDRPHDPKKRKLAKIRRKQSRLARKKS